jgi:hypothetical protein
MGDVTLFPGVVAITEIGEPQINCDEIILLQNILIERWRALGRVYDIPPDLRFELSELIRQVEFL